MRRRSRWLWAVAAVLGAGFQFAAQRAAAAPLDCEGLSGLKLPHAEITVATQVNGTFREDAEYVSDRAPKTFTGLPAFCRVRGVSRPTADSAIGFEVWLPVAGWSGRLHMVGNGAYSSNLEYPQMIARLAEGEIAVATDTGHQGRTLEFGRGHPEKIADFGYKAVHESVVAAKAVAGAYYGREPSWSYFSGCSTGGYQGLSEAQRYPDDFDGIIAGAPGNNRVSLTLAFLWNYLANHRQGDDARALLSGDDLLLINRAVVAACDDLDGVHDGVISAPGQCHFRTRSLRCRDGSKAGSCLTADQVAAAERMYAGPRDAHGRQIYPGYTFGSEGVQARSNDEHPGWSGYWSETSNPSEPSRADMYRYWVFNDPAWNWWTFDWDHDVSTMKAKLSPTFDANNPDLSSFRARGGKLIMFMGWQDPVGAAGEAINYYDAVEQRMPGATAASRRLAAQSFLRLFMVPGMGHCAGGPGATNFSSATRDSTPPIKDLEHDMTQALYAWVEKGRAPEVLVATRYAEQDDPQSPNPRAIAFQRPLCVYPQAPVYRGGPTADARSFTCAAPGAKGRR